MRGYPYVLLLMILIHGSSDLGGWGLSHFIDISHAHCHGGTLLHSAEGYTGV